MFAIESSHNYSIVWKRLLRSGNTFLVLYNMHNIHHLNFWVAYLLTIGVIDALHFDLQIFNALSDNKSLRRFGTITEKWSIVYYIHSIGYSVTFMCSFSLLISSVKKSQILAYFVFISNVVIFFFVIEVRLIYPYVWCLLTKLNSRCYQTYFFLSICIFEAL